ncbi:hypothetical protein [Pseudomonas juntendi]|uniref:Uncharacterized protein n=1 Tax=Pseudomonas juntendi TaxID=2666183 RepID=A0A7W2JJN4_9PSED|nr:hypothetical protein [Pseudomonas juntendi]MBA6060182.1 hypothetical protein [Pseudomonas juntendi]MBA6127321.1 hypothetical protein [Pseudomonas juntendi]
MWAKINFLFNCVKGHRITTAVVVFLGASATSLIYQVGGDIVDGRWSTDGVSLYLHSAPLRRGEPIYLFYASPSLVNGERLIVPVELNVGNDSDKVADKVLLTIKFPKGSGRDLIPNDIQRYSGPVSPKEVTLEVNANNEFVYANHRVSYMPPKDHINFIDGAFSVPVARAGRSYLSFPSGLDIKASLSSVTSSSKEWELRYRAVSAENTTQLRDWVKFDYGQRLAREFREREGFFKYVWGWALSKKVTVFGFYPDYQYDPKMKVYFPSNDPKEYKMFRFSPYSRELLFNGA